jgi:hypothetical protein
VFAIVEDGRRTVLTSAEIPHAAAKAAEKVAVEPTYLVKPGMGVTLDIQPEADDARKQAMVAALTTRLTRAGLIVQPDQPLRLVARTESRAGEAREYVGGLSGRQTVTPTVKTTRLSLERDGKVLWERSSTSSNDAGGFIILRNGETLQDYMSRTSFASVDWISEAVPPTTIISSADTAALPTSVWGIGGIKDKP